MSNIALIIEERPTHIGKFMVGRLLPFREKRMVGPFAFIDHMGPASMDGDENIDIPPHPHIGLSTLTYLFEGAVMHRDSLGTEMEILPGQVNWMTAGKGIVHSERTPEHQRGQNKTMHGLQIWVALPKDLEEMEPAFYHAGEEELPTWKKDGVHFKLIAGEALGKKSPVPVYSPLYLIEIKSREKKTISIGAELYGESALYILQGSVHHEGSVFGPKQLLVAKETELCEIEMGADTTLYLFGGDPFPEGRIIYWNFVASNQGLIDAAKEKWRAQTFEPVPGETEFVPLPER